MNLYSATSIAKTKSCHKQTVHRKARALGIIPITKGNGFYYTFDEVELMFSMPRVVINNYEVEVVYVTRTVEIYESKMNYQTDLK